MNVKVLSGAHLLAEDFFFFDNDDRITIDLHEACFFRSYLHNGNILKIKTNYHDIELSLPSDKMGLILLHSDKNRILFEILNEHATAIVKKLYIYSGIRSKMTESDWSLDNGKWLNLDAFCQEKILREYDSTFTPDRRITAVSDSDIGKKGWKIIGSSSQPDIYYEDNQKVELRLNKHRFYDSI